MAKYTNIQDIGTYFKKENVFLATFEDPSLAQSYLDSKSDGIEDIINHVAEECQIDDEAKSEISQFMANLAANGLLVTTVNVIVYKEDNIYSYFDGVSINTLKGDGSDGKPVLTDIVSIYNYCSEDMVKEAVVDGKYTTIILNVEDDEDPIEMYRRDVMNKNKICT